MSARNAPLLVFRVAFSMATSCPSIALAGALAIKCDRTGALYSTGELATFTVTGGAGQLSVGAVDFYGRKVIERILLPPENKQAAVAVDTAQLPRLGWHNVTVTADGKSASTVFATVPPPISRMPADQSPFGAIVSSRLRDNQVADFARSLKLVGVRWVDIDVPLAQLNPKEGEYIWDASGGLHPRQNFDRLVHSIYDEGLCLMLKFLGQADLISKRKGKELHAYWDAQLNLSPPSDPEKWAEVVAAVVGRYGGICHTWEIGNEPEGHGYFKGTDEEYTDYLETTSKAIRAVQPNATVVAASMYHGGGVLPRLVKRPDLYDIMSVHYLTGPADSISPLSHYQKALDAAGVKKVIWNTESRGTGGDEPPKPDETSHYRTDGARNQSPTKAYVRNLALGIPRVFVFSWNTGEGRQLVNPDFTPRWATVEYRTMVDQLEGARFVREVKLGNDLNGFQFQRGSDNILVAWSDLARHKAPIKLTAMRTLLVTDIMGNGTEISPAGGGASVSVSYQPVFITGVDADFEVR